MTDWLTESRDRYLECLLDFLWRQWTLLGVSGVSESQDHRIIDPEALLLFSLSMGRYEPRLFDEVIDWLIQNGHFINVQRLQRLQKKHPFACGPQLAAVAELLSQSAKYKLKWSGLAKTHRQAQTEALFFDQQGRPLPVPEEHNACPTFLAHGLNRGPVKLRGHSQPFDNQRTACLLLRMRALVGIHARAELLCVLASVKEIHPSQAARLTGYYQKTIQTTLSEMAQSGVILSRTTRKIKAYQLKSGLMDALLRPDDTPVQWIHWPSLLHTAEFLWYGLCRLSQASLDTLLLSSELIKLMRKAAELCEHANLPDIAVEPTVSTPEIPIRFQAFLHTVSRQLLP